MSFESNVPVFVSMEGGVDQSEALMQPDASSSKPTEGYDKKNTFRVTEIPGLFQKHGFHTAFAESLGMAFGDLEICSFSRDIHSQDRRTATVVFKKQPPFFISRGNLRRPSLEASEHSKPKDSCELNLQTSQGAYALILDQNFHGFTPLSPMETEASIQTDCFVVHGLGGHAIGSFRDKESHHTWIRDSLPCDIPELNVLTYGYDSPLVDEQSVVDVHEWAQEFRNAISRYRTRSGQRSSRPILFIVHSLGGWLFKEAITELAISHSPDDTFIVQCTLGALFFGVPSGGMDIKYLSAMASGGAEYTVQLLNREVGWRMRQRQHDEFCRAFSGNNRRIVQFKEGKKTKLADGTFSLLVDPNSSTSGRPEDSSSEFVHTIKEDHKDMVKFSRTEPENFRNVKHAIQKTFLSSVFLKRFHPAGEAPPPYIASPSQGQYDRLPSSSSRPQKRRYSKTDGSTLSNASSEAEDRSHQPVVPKRVARSKSARPFKWNFPDFTSRSYYNRPHVLEQLRAGMLAKEDRSFAIYGIGGIGKTQLAMKYIETYGSEYSYIFWLPADSEKKFETTVEALVRDLVLTKEVTLEKDQAFLLLKEWLGSFTDWLVIIDNVEQDPKELLKKVLSPLQGSLITTSRSPVMITRERVRGGLCLPALEEPEGAEFLLQRLRIEEGSGDNNFMEQLALAKEMSRELGGHPLALHTMSAYIKESTETLSTLLAAYRQDRSTYMSDDFDEVMKDVSFDYDRSLRTCFSLTLKPLHGGLGGDLLGILSMLDPDNISDDLLDDYARDMEKTEIPVLANSRIYNSAYMGLYRRGLVAISPGKVSIHRLVQDAWLHASEKRHSISSCFEQATKCLREQYPRQTNGESMAEGFSTCLALTAHVSKLKHHYERLYTASKRGTHTKLPDCRETFIELLADSGWYLYEKGDWQAGKAFQELAESICQDTFGNEPHKLTALVINNLGVIYGSQNDYEQELSCAMRTLAIREKCLPPNDPEMGNSYSNMGHTHIDKGDYEAAEKDYQRARHIHEAAETPSNDLLEGAYSCLGKSMLYRNRLEDAEYWINKAIGQHDGLPENFFVAETYFALGSLRMKQDRWDEAKRAIQKSLEIRETILGKKARLFGVCLHHLAFILHHEKDDETAIRHLRDCISIFRIPAQTQPGLLQRSMSKLASILKECGTKESIREANELIQEIAQMVKDDKTGNLSGLYPEDEKGWNSKVQVAYRCV